MLGPSGAYPATYNLMYAMVIVGKYVVAHYKIASCAHDQASLSPALPPPRCARPSGLPKRACDPDVPRGQGPGDGGSSHEIGEQLFAIAARVAENREWAGLHYASDTAAGNWLAVAVFPQVEDSFSESFQKAAREWL